MHLLAIGWMNQPRLLTHKKMIRAVRSQLAESGWTVAARVDQGFHLYADMRASKNNTTIYILLGSHDKPIKITDVTDLGQVTISSGTNAVYIVEGMIDPRICGRADYTRGTVISREDIALLESRLLALPPRVVGAVDAVRRTGTISGWARFSHGVERVKVHAYLGDSLQGKAEANIFRNDLTAFGDGKFGFKVAMPEIKDINEFLNDVRIRCYRGRDFIGLLRVWSKVEFND